MRMLLVEMTYDTNYQSIDQRLVICQSCCFESNGLCIFAVMTTNQKAENTQFMFFSFVLCRLN